ncbi:translation initiation factor IF-1 [candidate division WOR-3 bacterium]|nr:translation initiation factor IF-1 [candidate division WOR-3 bacterium]
MAKKDIVKVKGEVVEKLPDSKFRVKLDLDNQPIILAYLSGKMKMNYIKIDIGDIVDVELSPYDLTKGRVVYRES